MRTKDELKRDIEDVARQVGISEDAIDTIVNGKPLPQQKRGTQNQEMEFRLGASRANISAPHAICLF